MIVKLRRLLSNTIQFRCSQFSIAPPNQVVKFKKNFLQYPLQQLQQIKEDCKFLNQIPQTQLERICKVFYDHFFPVRRNKETIPQLIRNILIEEQLPQEQDEIYSRMISIVDFMDQAHIGFLTGDIHPDVLKTLEDELQDIVEKNISDKDEINLILKKQVFNQSRLYKIPKWGIKNPVNENPRNLFERQLVLEQESNDIALSKFQEVFTDLFQMHLAHNLHVAQKYLVDWFPQLCHEIQKEQEACVINNTGDRNGYGKYLLCFRSERLAVIALTELIKELIATSVKYHRVAKSNNIDSKIYTNQISLSILTREVSNQINKQYVYEQELKSQKEFQKKQMTTVIKENPENSKKIQIQFQKQHKISEERLKMSLQSHSYISRYSQISIPKEILLKLSQVLIFLMKETIKIPNIYGLMVPLIIQNYKYDKIQEKKHIVLNVNEQFLEKLYQGLSKDNAMHMHLDRSLPTIYPPSPWEDPEIGGYYLRPTNLVKLNDVPLTQLNYVDLSRLYNVLDIIARVPWRINDKVLKIVKGVWNSGGGVAEIPIQGTTQAIIEVENLIKECKKKEEKYKLIKKLQQLRDQHSLRCDFKLKLGVAESFSGVSRIFFPHNVDFRGRLYPIPPHLNHMGNDIGRGLLEFSEAKPLGERGLYWLKVHLANKMGKDKLSMQDRVQYVESNLDLILRCAQDPLKHKDWIDLENPWQSLAAMIELFECLKLRDPTKYESRIHVHQDGSCNGLQHYAALGRDIDGAHQVNLAQTNKPGDVYSHVAGMVEQRVQNDANNSESKFQQIAQKLLGHIKRKIVKQTVMTSVYGVTFIGAREQIHKQLKDKEILAEDEEIQYQASFYLAQITLDAIKNLFDGAHRIKQWLIQCASIISNLDKPVSWITPLGLPVIQPYRNKSLTDVVQTVMQSVIIQQNPNDLPIAKLKQRSAFPPNFIHSLDSTHLMYTAIECDKENITFAAVHDSYWTHPSTVDRLNVILREQFVKLHNQPILEELRESFMRRYPEADFPPIPERGQFNLERVKESVYFFA